MELKSTKHVGKMGVVVDEATDKAEVVKVDTLKMKRFSIDYEHGQIHVAFAWGGYDSTGKWRWADGINACERSINSQVGGEREIYEKSALCPKGNPLGASDLESIVEKVLFEHGQIERIVNGGWRLDHLDAFELIHPTRGAVFSKGVVKQIK